MANAQLASRQIYTLLRDNSNNTQIGGASTTATSTFAFNPGRTCMIERVNVPVVDGSMTPDKFAGLSALTNGLLIRVCDAAGVEQIDYTDGEGIKTNSDWGILAGSDNTIVVAAGTGGMVVRWTIAKSGSPLLLPANHEFQVIRRDNLVGITSMKAMVQGRFLD